MEDTAASASADVKGEERLANCFNCKRSKLKCVRSSGSSECNRCRQRGIECTAPAYHVGRYKGVKNKHSGLEKAVHQIEQALKRSQGRESQFQSADQAAELRYLLSKSQELLSAAPASGSAGDQREQSASLSGTPSSLEASSIPSGTVTDKPLASVERDHLDLDDAENPLQLLARTSELLSAIAPPTSALNANRRRAPHGGAGAGLRDAEDDIGKFFGQFRPRLDVGNELDPVELGLITQAEAEALFSYFFDKLAHTRWGIDSVIHTVDFVRSRSAYLFTSIVTASALFSPSLEALHKRLSNHRQKLAGLIMANGYKSIEIILAFMVNVPWISAGEHWADDETSTYISMALSIALDLSINKVIHPSPSGVNSPGENLASADCISAKKALAMDGFEKVEPTSILGRRLLRRRERTWLSLFVLERGVCLARGRSYVLPMSPLIERCDQWHLSDLADRWDGSIVSVAVLRRDLSNLILSVRSICDQSVELNAADGVVVERLKNEITVFFDRWYQTWPFQIGDREQLALPPYVEILASHTRLSMYSSVINHSTAPLAARHYFRAAGLSSALNVLRVAVQGESQLKSMPNNTAIMISYAACFAMRVSTVADGRGSTLAPSIRALISQTTDALDRIGSTPTQRKGLSCLFAQQLRQIHKLATRPLGSSRNSFESNREAEAAPVAANMPPVTMQPVMHLPIETSSAMPSASDYYMFSAMSNRQLDEAINNTDIDLNGLLDDFQFQNGTDLDWMDWSTFS